MPALAQSRLTAGDTLCAIGLAFALFGAGYIVHWLSTPSASSLIEAAARGNADRSTLNVARGVGYDCKMSDGSRVGASSSGGVTWNLDGSITTYDRHGPQESK